MATAARMHAATGFEYGIMRFSSKSRVQGSGVPFWSMAGGVGRTSGPRIVHSKAAHRTADMWAKVRGSELVELLGGTGDSATEARVLRLHYGITPCRYPSIDRATDATGLKAWTDAEEVSGAVTVDHESTEDRDDALSWVSRGDGDGDGGGVLGIHITEVAARLPEALRAWALERGASAYWSEDDGRPTSTPMLPPELAHVAFSLQAGSRHPCRSLFLTLDAEGAVIGERMARTWVTVSDNLTYDALRAAPSGSATGLLRAALERYARTADPEEQVAAAMIAYNLAYARLLCAEFPGGLLRVQESSQEPATYDRVDSGRTHASMDRQLYCHLTSPIRRFADLHNQAVLGGLDWSLSDADLAWLQERTAQIQMFHAHEASLRLAAECKERPRILDAVLEAYEDGRYLRLHLPERRVRVPLRGSFYAEPLVDAIHHAPAGARFTIELFGILREGRTELRLRWIDRASSPPPMSMSTPSPAPAVVPAATAVASDEHPTSAGTTTERNLGRMEAILGYPLDAFQRRCLETIEAGHDIISCAPTGSGKTSIAVLAMVLRAFDLGKRCILTCPVKALSNQKYKEFDQWIRRLLGEDVRRVTLLTGDIQARATPPGGDGKPELLIMTSEILANKLEASALAASPDPDLVNLGAVIMDEAHYISSDRGHVWERTIVHLPPSVHITALSATLDHPERFAEWMSMRRSAKVVQRLDRHVPLHVGMFDARGTFCEFYGTHAHTKTLASAAYDAARKGHDRGDASSLPRLMQALDREDKLPAIVFFLSRAKCVAAAESIRANLLMGTKVAPRAKEECEYEHAYKVEVQMERVREIRQRQRELFGRYLRPFQDVLETLPGFPEFLEMLERGVAYHHAGMLPILREYVELLFQERLLRVVFATETLGIGLDMPCRTVVFTQLDKPDAAGSFRLLRPDEFWQMAGRAGRRGRDDRGFVVYAPLHRPAVAAHELASLLTGRPPEATSQLEIDPVFVLRQRVLGADDGGRVLQKTLRQYEMSRRRTVLEAERARLSSGSDGEGEGEVDVADQARIQRLHVLREKLNPAPGSLFKLTPQQRKKALQEISAIEKERSLAGRKEVDLVALQRAAQQRRDLDTEIAACRSMLEEEWNASTDWLMEKGFLMRGSERVTPTAKGRAAALFMDGEPLVRGALVWEGALADATVEEVVVWLACFADRVPLRPGSVLDKPSRILLDRTRAVAIELGVDPDKALAWESAYLVERWMTTHDVREICVHVDPAQLGSFVRMVNRVHAYLEQLRSAALGLEMLDLYNLLEGASEQLYRGVVTNRSLYVGSAN